MNKEAIERTKARCKKAQCNRVKHGDWDYLGWAHAKLQDDVLRGRITTKPIFMPEEIKSHDFQDKYESKTKIVGGALAVCLIPIALGAITFVSIWLCLGKPDIWWW